MSDERKHLTEIANALNTLIEGGLDRAGFKTFGTNVRKAFVRASSGWLDYDDSTDSVSVGKGGSSTLTSSEFLKLTRELGGVVEELANPQGSDTITAVINELRRFVENPSAGYQRPKFGS